MAQDIDVGGFFSSLFGGSKSPDVSRWLTYPWSAATADAAHQLVTAAGMGDKAAKKQLDTVKALAFTRGPVQAAARQAWLMFGKTSKLVLQGRPAPSVILARGTLPPGQVVAVPVSAATRRAAQQLQAAQRQIVELKRSGKQLEAQRRERVMFQTQIAELNKQLERRDWSDETRRQLEAQRAAFQAQLAALAPGAVLEEPAATDDDEQDDEDELGSRDDLGVAAAVGR
jgi:hypothetical protein